MDLHREYFLIDFAFSNSGAKVPVPPTMSPDYAESLDLGYIDDEVATHIANFEGSL